MLRYRINEHSADGGSLSTIARQIDKSTGTRNLRRSVTLENPTDKKLHERQRDTVTDPADRRVTLTTTRKIVI